MRRPDLSSCTWRPYAIVSCLHVLLWLSVAAVFIVINLISTAFSDGNLRASAILLAVSTFVTLAYISLHCFIALWQVQDKKDAVFLRRPSYIAIRVSALTPLLWLITSGWNMILAARQAICLPANKMIIYGEWQAGKPCVVHRLSTCLSLLALFTAVLLFCVMAGNHNGFDTHLFGTRKCKEVTDAQEEKATPLTDSPKRPARYHARSNSTSTTPRSASAQNGQPAGTQPTASGRTAVNALGITIPPHPSHFRNPSASYSASTVSTMCSAKNGRSQSLTSPYLTSPYRSPQGGYMSESAWKAVHPPAYHFKHAQTSTYPVATNGPVRWIPPSPRAYPQHQVFQGYPGYVAELRTPALYSSNNQSYAQSFASYSRPSSRAHSRAGSTTNASRMYVAPNGMRLHSSPSSRSLSSRSNSNRSGTSNAPYRPRNGHSRSLSDTVVSSSAGPRIPFAHTRKTSSSSVITAASLTSHPLTKSATGSRAVDGVRLETELTALARRQQVKEQLREGKLLTDAVMGRRRSMDTSPRAIRKMPSEGYLPTRRTVSRLNMGGALHDSRTERAR